MKQIRKLTLPLAGFLAGCISGLFGAGGGMILVPFLSASKTLRDDEMFPSSVAIILPICILTLLTTAKNAPLPWLEALPYLFGSAVGGTLAGVFGKQIPATLLHRLLGILILWGGVKQFC